MVKVQLDAPVALRRCKEHPLLIESKAGWASGF